MARRRLPPPKGRRSGSSASCATRPTRSRCPVCPSRSSTRKRSLHGRRRPLRAPGAARHPPDQGGPRGLSGEDDQHRRGRAHRHGRRRADDVAVRRDGQRDGRGHRPGDLVGRSAADRAQAGVGHHRQRRLAGDEAERRQRRRRRDDARDRPVARGQPVRLRARSGRALQQHDARRVGAADDRARQEGGAARPVPDRPHRQRAGQQVVLAGPLGGVRRRPGADRADEAAEPAGRRFLLRLQPLLDGDRQEHPAEPAWATATCGASTTARGRCRPAFPADKIVRQGIYTPDVGYTADQITEFGRLLEQSVAAGQRERPPGQNWSATFGNRFGEHSASSPASRTRTRSSSSKRIAASSASPAPASSRTRATTTSRPARRRRSSASSATWPISSIRASG